MTYITSPPAPNLSHIKMHTLSDVREYLGATKNIDIPLLREGCRICEIPFIGGGKMLIKRGDSADEELFLLKQELAKQLSSQCEYIVAYEKVINLDINSNAKPHPTYSNYFVLAVRSSDLLDLKKAYKVQKLKAFL